MYSRESTSIKVGIFIFSGLFLAMAVIFILGGQKQLFKRHYELTTSFKDISGLRVGAPVLLAGVSVGMVDEIGIAPDPNKKEVLIYLTVNRQFQDRIRQDSRASLSTQGLLGDKFVLISLGDQAQRKLEDGEFIPSVEGASVNAAVEKFTKVADVAEETIQTLKRLFHEVETGNGLIHDVIYETPDRALAANVSAATRELKTASKELSRILQKINRGEGTIGALMTDPSVYNDIRRLFARVERNKILSHVIRSRARDLELEKTEKAATKR